MFWVLWPLCMCFYAYKMQKRPIQEYICNFRTCTLWNKKPFRSLLTDDRDHPVGRDHDYHMIKLSIRPPNYHRMTLRWWGPFISPRPEHRHKRIMTVINLWINTWADTIHSLDALSVTETTILKINFLCFLVQEWWKIKQKTTTKIKGIA